MTNGRNRLILMITLISLSFCIGAHAKTASKKVLYITHEPGKWHKLTPQKEIFKQIAAKTDWELTVASGTHKEQEAFLRTDGFGKGYDVLVYNICLGKDADLDIARNIMKQTRELGAPAIMIHCSTHSFRSSHVPDRVEKAKAKWKEKHAGEAFPVWGDFLGIASSGHGKKGILTTKKLRDHPILKGVPDSFKTSGETELYNNIYALDAAVPILEAHNPNKEEHHTAVIVWTHPQGRSEVIGFTLGHDSADWEMPEFQKMLTNAVDYLIAK